MKKIVAGICGLIIIFIGLANIRNGVLKADELTSDTTTMEIFTTQTVIESTSDTSKEVIISVEESSVEDIRSSQTEVIPETSTSETEGIENNTNESIDNSSEYSSSTVSNDSSKNSSTTNSSTSNRSVTSSSTSPSSNTGTDQSSSTLPSSSATKPSTSHQREPAGNSADPVPASPATPVSNLPEESVFNGSHVQRQSVLMQEVPEAFSNTSTLKLPSELKTTEVAQSDLNGFEIPLLSQLENEAYGVLIYEGVKQLGIKQTATFTTDELAMTLYKKLFDLEITETPEKVSEELLIGSLLYQEKEDQTVFKPQVVGIYIGENHYLSVTDVEIDEDDTRETAERELEEEKNSKKEMQRQVTVETLDIESDEVLSIPFPESEVMLTEYGQQVLSEYPASMNFTENEGTKSFIETIGEDARTLGQEYDVFASVMIAQALLESGSGTSELSLAPNYNLFGIKGAYQGSSVSMVTQEDRGNGELYSINSAFRKYPNYAASLGDYVELLRSGIAGNSSYYQKTWRSTSKNYLRTTEALTGTYATDTTYAKKLNSIIALYHLTQYDQAKVETNSGVFIKGKEEIPEEYRTMMEYSDYNGVDYNTSGSYPVGQCTWYAYNRVKQLGKTVDDYMGNGGEWGTKGKALGYEVSQTPKAGWLISFKPGVAGSDPHYGHVAFVEVVRSEGILISEGNVYGGTVFSYRVIDKTLATSKQVSYIKAK